MKRGMRTSVKRYRRTSPSYYCKDINVEGTGRKKDGNVGAKFGEVSHI